MLANKDEPPRDPETIEAYHKTGIDQWTINDKLISKNAAHTLIVAFL